jgi:hypothetical protein
MRLDRIIEDAKVIGRALAVIIVCIAFIWFVWELIALALEGLK